MIQPSNSPENRIPQTQEAIILLTLKISTKLDTSLWPGHIVLAGEEAAGAWRYLDEIVLSGKAVSGSDSHILALDIPEDQDTTGLPIKARLGEQATQTLIPFLQHCQRMYPAPELHALNNLEYAMQGSSVISLYDHEGYSWDVQTSRAGRQVWNKWVEDKLVDSWEPGGHLSREQVLEFYRKWTLNLRSEDWRKGC